MKVLVANKFHYVKGGAEEAGLVPTRTWKKKRFGEVEAIAVAPMIARWLGFELAMR